jgi:MtN3 and saliva related transmembrane protein
VTTVVGALAAVLTAVCWVPQVVRTLRRGTAEDFSWPYLALLSTGVALWSAYGLLREDPPIYLCNLFVLGSVLVVVAVKVRTRHLVVEGVDLAVAPGTDPVTALESLVEVGPRLAADLAAVGIADGSTLRAVGVAEAVRRLEAAGHGSAHAALEGVLGGGHWSAGSRRPPGGGEGRPVH